MRSRGHDPGRRGGHRGIASVDEAAITGESAPVIRESGGDRSAVTGTRVLSDRIVVRITLGKGNTFLDRMIAMVEGASRQKTPTRLRSRFFCLRSPRVPAGMRHTRALWTLFRDAVFPAGADRTPGLPDSDHDRGLLSAIGISGIDHRSGAMSWPRRDARWRQLGTWTCCCSTRPAPSPWGNRMASEFLPALQDLPRRLAMPPRLASLAGKTPRGRSIVVLAKERFGFPRTRTGGTPCAICSVCGANPDERRQFARWTVVGSVHPEGGGRFGAGLCSTTGRALSRAVTTVAESVSRQGDAVGGCG